MLLGVWGPFAVGKTTYLTDFLKKHEGDPHYRKTIFVMADLSLEYRMGRDGKWVSKFVKGDEDHWKGKQDDKETHIRDMVADDRYMWVVESARYFSGMYDCLVEAHNLCDGGLRFIIPITDGPTMIKFMKARCVTRNKQFRDDYWGTDRVAYEADKRYTNAAEKWFRPRGIPFIVVNIDETRSEFYRVGAVLDTWNNVGADNWYSIAHGMRVLAGVQEDVEIERAKERGVYRKGRY